MINERLKNSRYNMELLKHIKNMDMTYLSNQIKILSNNNSKFKSMIGDDYDQLNDRDITDFFSPIAEAIFNCITTHDYLNVEIIKNDFGRSLMLETSFSIYKFSQLTKPDVKNKIIIYGIRKMHVGPMLFAHVICKNKESITFLLSDILTQLYKKHIYKI